MEDKDNFRTLEERISVLEKTLRQYEQRLQALEADEPPTDPYRKPEYRSAAGGAATESRPNPINNSAVRSSNLQSAAAGPRKPVDREHLEAKIGGTWLNRIGVLAFILGVAFFLKYAFDNNWIGPAGRVALGLTAGLALLTGGEFAQKKRYEKFAQGITGGGIAILYLSIFAAFNFYQLIPQIPAFALMILVTATAVLLAVRYNSPATAVLGVIGGFLTPFLLSTGKVNVFGLFTYLALLDLGILATAYFKNWRLLNYLSFVFTELIIISWLFDASAHEVWTRQAVFTVFFLIFAFLSFFYNIIHRKETEPADLALIFLNAGLFFGLSYGNLETDYKAFMGFFAVMMAVVYFSLGWLTIKVNKEDKNLTLIFLGVALIFLTLAIPIQLTGSWITVAWAVEGAVLLWIGLKTGSVRTRYGALIIYVLTLCRLIGYDTTESWHNFISSEQWGHTIYLMFLNFKTLAFVVGIAACLAGAYLYANTDAQLQETEKKAGTVLNILANLLVLWLLSTEIANYFDSRSYLGYANQIIPTNQAWNLEEAKQLTLSAVWAVYSIFLVAVGIIEKYQPVRLFAMVLFGVTILKVFLYDLSNLDTIFRILSFVILGVILILVSFLYQKYKTRISSFVEDDKG